MKKITLIAIMMMCSAFRVSAQKIYSVKYQNQADVKVYAVKYENQADVKIYFVKYENQAGWVNKSKQHLMY